MTIMKRDAIYFFLMAMWRAEFYLRFLMFLLDIPIDQLSITSNIDLKMINGKASRTYDRCQYVLQSKFIKCQKDINRVEE